MPENAPASKVTAVRAYGGDITFCESTQAARERTLQDLCRRTGASFIPPYDHPHIVAGQGTTALEVAEQCSEPAEFLIVPVGGGGLLAGCALASKSLLPGCQVIGAEPSGANDAMRSFYSGMLHPQHSPDTIADGLRTGLGEINFRIIREHVDDILCADDTLILQAMRLVWTRMKLVIEPSAAIGLAVVLTRPERFKGKRVTIILSGGNVDIDELPW
jgi:threonine dehydratase